MPMSPILCLDDLIIRARSFSRRSRITVAVAHEETVLSSVADALSAGIVTPILIGDRSKIVSLTEELGLGLSGCEIVNVQDSREAVRLAVSMVHHGQADMVMKGLVPTRNLLKMVLDPHEGLRSDSILSHVAVFRPPTHDRVFMLTDSGVNIAPNFSRKVQIVRNAIEVARKLGISRPKVAMIAAIERVELPAMPATLDAKVVERMCESGAFPDAVIQGPLGLDNAVSEDLARLKGIQGEVAGRADILCVPDIEAGNVLYKTLTCFGGVDIAGTLVGARAPVVLTSRSDTPKTKLYSIALAAILSQSQA